MKKGMMVALLAGAVMVTGGLVARKKDVSEYTRIASDDALCSESSCSMKNRKSCSCWCSVLCGPREMIKKQDNPVFTGKDSKGTEIPTRCYCNQYDADNYLTNCVAKGQGMEAQESESPEAEDQSQG